ncbi:MAG TPA: VOC family protein [Gaiellaceae bacterium]|nr:VOC family protein [Gaiellaceae bacterium]
MTSSIVPETTNGTLRRARHVGIVVGSMDAALRFYRDLLGLELVRHLVEEGDYIDALIGVNGAKLDTHKLTVPGDGFVIELMEIMSHPGDPIAPVFPDLGASHVAFEVSDIDELHERLSAAGVTFVSPVQSSPYDPVKTVFCRDPDGTLVQFVEFLEV